MAADDTRFDGLFFQAAQQVGGIDSLFDAFFGFLSRKTDFYVGCKDKPEAEKMMQKSFDRYWAASEEKRRNEAAKNAKIDAEKAAKRLAKEKKDREEWEASNQQKKGDNCSFEEVDEDMPVGVVKSSCENGNAPLSEPKEQHPEEEDTTPPPVGNGGTVEGKYSWVQTLSTADMYIPIKPGTQSRELKVEIKADSLKVIMCCCIAILLLVYRSSIF